MEFGLFLAHQRIRRPETYATSLYTEKRIEAELADRLGFDMIWIPEHHLIHFMQAPNALMLAQYLGSGLSLRVGTMATLLPLRHPLITAAEVNLTAELLGDRFEFGVGRGAYRYEFERLGIPFSETPARFTEVLEFLQRTWASETGAAGMDGEFYRFDAAAPWPRVPGGTPPRLWMTAMTLPSIAAAAAEGHNVATWPFIRSMESLAESAATFQEGRRIAGKQTWEQQLTVLRAGFVSHSEDELSERIDEALENHRINQRLHYFTQNADASGVVEPDLLEDEPSREDVRKNLLIGTPEEVLEKVMQYDALGIDQLMIQFDYGPDHEAVVRSMELFATEVMEPYRAAKERAYADREGLRART